MRKRNRTSVAELKSDMYEYARSLGGTFEHCRAASRYVEQLVDSMNTDRMVVNAGKAIVLGLVRSPEQMRFSDLPGGMG
jgi:hypothetical protein